MSAVQRQVEHRGVQHGLDCLDLPRRRRSCNGEDSGTDDDADSERRQAPWSQRLPQPPAGFIGGGDQLIDTAGTQLL